MFTGLRLTVHPLVKAFVGDRIKFNFEGLHYRKAKYSVTVKLVLPLLELGNLLS